MILRAILLFVFGGAFLLTGMIQHKGLTIGDEATDFSLANVDGTVISLETYEHARGYIVIFTCNSCPYAQAYQGRISLLHQQYAAKGYPVIAINTSDSKAEIIARATEQQYPFPYLHDESQDVSRAYGATKTPHAYVLTKDKKVAYVGAIDNNYKNAADADQHYVKDAVDALLANKEVPVQSTRAIGCSIKWKNS
jgi:peroxiredoxin